MPLFRKIAVQCLRSISTAADAFHKKLFTPVTFPAFSLLWRLIKLLRRFSKDQFQLVGIKRLEQIIKDAKTQSCFCICKFVIGREQDNQRRMLQFLNKPGYFKAVQARHMNIENDNIRMEILDFLPCFVSVFCESDQLKAPLVPGNRILHGLQRELIVIRDQYLFSCHRVNRSSQSYRCPVHFPLSCRNPFRKGCEYA